MNVNCLSKPYIIPLQILSVAGIILVFMASHDTLATRPNLPFVGVSPDPLRMTYKEGLYSC
jgi:hypothetical protein